jgi:hypothetical protein
MRLGFTKTAQAFQENERRHLTKCAVYFSESSVAKKGSSSGRPDGNFGAGGASREMKVLAVETALVLLLSFLAILLAQSVASARDFASQTVTSQRSYSGVKMQQGNPQLDNDRKSFRVQPPVSTALRAGQDVQQGRLQRDVKGIDAGERSGKSSIIFCRTNCVK